MDPTKELSSGKITPEEYIKKIQERNEHNEKNLRRIKDDLSYDPVYEVKTPKPNNFTRQKVPNPTVETPSNSSVIDANNITREDGYSNGIPHNSTLSLSDINALLGQPVINTNSISTLKRRNPIEEIENNASDSSPPSTAFHSKAIAPFLNKLYNLVDDPEYDFVIRWCNDGKSFIIINPDFFSKQVLPRFFKHKNLSSFVRQSNLYGFHKVQNLRQGVLMEDAGSEMLQFYHPKFQRGRIDLLSEVIRKSKTSNKGYLLEPENSKKVVKEKPNLEVKQIIEELNTLKKKNEDLANQVQDMQLMNDKLWKANQEARTQGKNQQDTINKILHFLSTLFAQEKSNEKVPRKRRLLLEQPQSPTLPTTHDQLFPSQPLGSPSSFDQNAALAKLLQEYSNSSYGLQNDFALNNFNPYFPYTNTNLNNATNQNFGALPTTFVDPNMKNFALTNDSNTFNNHPETMNKLLGYHVPEANKIKQDANDLSMDALLASYTNGNLGQMDYSDNPTLYNPSTLTNFNPLSDLNNNHLLEAPTQSKLDASNTVNSIDPILLNNLNANTTSKPSTNNAIPELMPFVDDDEGLEEIITEVPPPIRASQSTSSKLTP